MSGIDWAARVPAGVEGFRVGGRYEMAERLAQAAEDADRHPSTGCERCRPALSIPTQPDYASGRPLAVAA